MRSFSKIVCPILLGLAVVSCSRQEAERYSDGIIRVRVDSEGSKSSVVTTDGLKTNPGRFVMEAYVDRDVFTDPEGQHALTRVGNAYFGPTSKLYENVVYTKLYENVVYNGSVDPAVWQLSYWDPGKASASPCYWVSSEGNMSFWSWVKLQKSTEDISIDRENSALYLTSPNVDETKGVKMVFDYTLPTPTAETDPSATSFSDASNQEDLVFSYWEDALENTTPDADEPTYPEEQEVWVHFYHALAQIRFAFSNNDGSFEDGLQIKSIAISEVVSGGTCIFWGNLAMNEFVNKDPYQASNNTRDVASLFTWSDLKSSKTYRQDYGITVKDPYSEASEYAGWTLGSYTKNSDTFNLFTCQNVFMMIPQTLTSSACVRLTVFDPDKPEGQKEQEFVSYLKPLGATWEPGKYYTYKLNYLNNQITFSLDLVAWGTIGETKQYTID